ncbi:MAG: nucleotide pyrophosphatase/phosphodiesterase family protein [Planctomycetota bacterium]
MQPVAVLNVVGLTSSLLPHAPRIAGYAQNTGGFAPLAPVFPALTCPVQASMLTGLPPGNSIAPNGHQPPPDNGHGIVANGWYHRDLAEIRFWQRPDHLVHGEKIWDAGKKRDPSFTSANLFWWHNTYSTCDLTLQARPIYKADGRKLPDCYCNLPAWRDKLQRKLGPFPLFRFWGPLADIASSQWIAEAAVLTHQHHHPTLNLVYLPHLDYGLQKLGPDHLEIPKHVAQIDRVVGQLLDYYRQQAVRVLILSEYGIQPTLPQNAAIPINRYLRDAGLLAVRTEDQRELLDPGASDAFAVTDHQIAHVYHHPDIALPALPGCHAAPLSHPRAGDTVLVADPGRWFTYDYWPADRPGLAPDFARTVDIHRKPGYDPRELFSSASPAAIAWKLLRKKLGFRQLMDVIPLNPDYVRGTHGRTDLPSSLQPLLIGLGRHPDGFPVTAVKSLLLDQIFS